MGHGHSSRCTVSLCEGELTVGLNMKTHEKGKRVQNKCKGRKGLRGPFYSISILKK